MRIINENPTKCTTSVQLKLPHIVDSAQIGGISAPGRRILGQVGTRYYRMGMRVTVCLALIQY